MNLKDIKEYAQVRQQEAQIQLQLAIDLEQQGRLVEAEEAANKALQLGGPTNATAFAVRGIILLKKGEVEYAITDLSTALDFDPNNEMIKKFLRLAKTQLRKKNKKWWEFWK